MKYCSNASGLFIHSSSVDYYPPVHVWSDLAFQDTAFSRPYDGVGSTVNAEV